MKMLSFLSLMFSLAAALAETTNSLPARISDSLGAEIPKLTTFTNLVALKPKPNEISIGSSTISGITVEAANSHSLLQLINPFSPPKKSSSEDNVVRDPLNGKLTGLSLFAIHFK